MLYARLLFGAIVVLFALYYIMAVGQLFGAWKITNKRLTFSKLIIPFYYWVV